MIHKRWTNNYSQSALFLDIIVAQCPKIESKKQTNRTVSVYTCFNK